MTDTPRDPNWPRFWSDVPEDDRAPLRQILAELLGRGTLLGTEGSGRDLFLLARDHYQEHLADYMAPLGLELIVDDDHSLLQARPKPEACLLLGRFSKAETLILLVLWRVWDDVRTTQASQAVTLTADQLWTQFRSVFDKIEPPEKTQLDQLLDCMKRHRLIRTQRPEGATQIGETVIEILPSLARAVPFDNIEQWLGQARLYQAIDSPDAPAEEAPPTEVEQPQG